MAGHGPRTPRTHPHKTITSSQNNCKCKVWARSGNTRPEYIPFGAARPEYNSGRRAPNTIRGGASRIPFGAERRSAQNTIRAGAPRIPFGVERTAHGRYGRSAGRRPFARRRSDVRREQNRDPRNSRMDSTVSRSQSTRATEQATALVSTAVGDRPRQVLAQRGATAFRTPTAGRSQRAEPPKSAPPSPLAWETARQLQRQPA